MTTAPGTGRRWQRPGGQYVENNFFGTVDAHGAQIGIINLGAAAEPDPPGSIRDAAIALFDDPAPPATDKPSTPGAWLDPRAGIVPARHRPEISELVAWCRSEPGPVARLMCAPGGQGKTHLAIGLCAALAASPEPERRRLRRRDRPWLAGFVRLPASWQYCDRAERARWLRLVAAIRAVPALGVTGALLVVDYPDGHQEFVQQLVYEAIEAAAGARLRVLLLARAEPDWWRNIADIAPAGTVDPEPLSLASLPVALAAARAPAPAVTRALAPAVARSGDEPAVTGELWASAVAAFAGRAAATGLLPGGQPTARALTLLTAGAPERFATTLDLYADALVHVLDHAEAQAEVRLGRIHPGPVEFGDRTGDAADGLARPRTGGGPAGDPLYGVLRHERRLFVRAAGLDSLDTGLRRDLAVSVAFLRPAAGLASAVAALAAAPELSRLPADGLRHAALALAAAYPPAAGGQPAGGRPAGGSVWQAPRPDRLPDTHLLDTAQRSDTDADWCEHVAGVCGTDDPAVTEHAALVLARVLSTPGADARYPDGLRRIELSITTLVRRYPAGYVRPLVALAPGRFAGVLVEQVGSDTLPAAAVTQLDAGLRAAGFTSSRMSIAVAVSRRLVAQTLPPAGDPAVHAEHLVLLSRRLAEVGSIAAALPPARQAVDLLRPPAGAEPGRDPGNAPNSAPGNAPGSVPGAGRGVTAARAWFATALTNLGNRLAEHGAADDALAVTAEAAELRRALAAAGGSRVELAYAMNNLALRLLDVGRADDAAAPAREAVELLGSLAQADPAHRPRLAVALISLSTVLGAAARAGEARAPAERAVHLLRELAAQRPDTYLPDLAAALITLSQHAAPRAGRGKRTPATRQAADLAAEAVRIYRQLSADPATAAAPTPAAEPTAAAAEPTADAAGATADAAEPAGFRRELAAALTNLGVRLADAAQPDRAASETQRAVAIHRELAAGDPDLHRAELAAALTNLALQLTVAQGAAAAIEPAREAVTLYRSLAAQPVSPSRHTPSEQPPPGHAPDKHARDEDLAAGLVNLGYVLAAAGRLDEAVAATGEAVTAYRRLLAGAPQPPAEHRIWLADALVNLARHQLVAAPPAQEQARDAVLAAIDLYAQTEQTHPNAAHDRFRAALALLARAGGDPATQAAPVPNAPVPAPKDADRYCRRWHEVAVRSSLPGVAALAAWRTDLAPRLHRRRSIREEYLALLDRRRSATTSQGAQPAAGLPTASVAATTASGTASTVDEERRKAVGATVNRAGGGRVSESPAAALGAVPAPVVAPRLGLVERVRAAVTSRAATMPGSDLVVHLAQQNPDAFRRVVTAIVGGVVLVGVVAIGLLIGDGRPVAAPPTSTPPIPTTAAPGTDPTTTVPNTDPPTTHPPATTTAPATTRPSRTEAPTPAGEPAAEPVVPLETVTTTQQTTVVTTAPPEQPSWDIGIDATAMAYASFSLDDVSGQSSRQLNTSRLSQGTHSIVMWPTHYRIDFRVTDTGRVDYDASLDRILTGRNTAMLTVLGLPITVDSSATDYTNSMWMMGIGFVPSNRAMGLLPGAHTVQYNPLLSASRIQFWVTDTGSVDYDAGLGDSASGRGGPNLVLHGFAITIDLSATDYAGVAIAFTRSRPPATEPIRTYQLLPGPHTVTTGGGIQFRVTDNGGIDFDPSLDGVWSVRNTSTLVASGLPVTIDTSAADYLSSRVSGTASSTAPVRQLRLVPGSHTIQTGSADSVGFQITPDGLIDLGPGGGGNVLSGQDTSTLVVHGFSITIDATATDYTGIGVKGVRWHGSALVGTVKLLPGWHNVQSTTSPGGGLAFSVTKLGLIAGQDTSLLVVRGLPITIDATATSQASFTITGVRPMGARQEQTVLILAGLHRLRLSDGRQFDFVVGSDGFVNYQPNLDAALSGRGTTRLTVRGS